MRTVLTTETIAPHLRFRLWREMLLDRIGPLEQKQIDDRPFQGRIETADVGDIRITRVAESGLRTEVTPATLRRRDDAGTVFVLIQLAGRSKSSQDGRDAVQGPGDIMVLGGRPNVHLSSHTDRSLVLELPRERLEDFLGPTKVYTAFPVGPTSPGALLAANFFQGLSEMTDDLAPETAGRLSKIGVDLIVASLAERLAQELPQDLYGTVIIQRAKAYVEENLADPTLDPRQLAAAMGLSLRRLQELFHKQGQHISDWIWERRLRAAGQRLSDSACGHLAIAVIAYGCGFSNSAHFSRRFKDRFGLTPREYRSAALGVPTP
ncbi:helix-turn-helix domain-containing protein [Methylobacterium sp. Leaf100]|uniref:helix-turn-helix domain-containing protein n=1 Tax=Methylobacterium sp. Leaf100 TaxID=1736252 RepID=UPI0006FFB139|nr:helix-turn-helix domain-containing protein [Methylobacterium sp. Leaf100]KQP18941.1 AraC family transcriptional regulator [Methylobacterium sp. Leaf100]